MFFSFLKLLLFIEQVCTKKCVLYTFMDLEHALSIVMSSKTHRSQRQARPSIPRMTLVAESPHNKYGSAVFISDDLNVKGISMGEEDDVKRMAPNDTAYTRWSCHSGLTNPVQIVSTPPSPSNGGPITVFWADPLDGWQCSS